MKMKKEERRKKKEHRNENNERPSDERGHRTQDTGSAGKRAVPAHRPQITSALAAITTATLTTLTAIATIAATFRTACAAATVASRVARSCVVLGGIALAAVSVAIVAHGATVALATAFAISLVIAASTASTAIFASLIDARALRLGNLAIAIHIQLCLQSGASRVASSFPFGFGKLAVAVGVKQPEPFGVASIACRTAFGV